jgi:hypothetical protein
MWKLASRPLDRQNVGETARRKGLSVVDLGDESARAALGRLHDEVDAHVSVRLPWLRAWQETHPRWRPWVLALRDDRGELRAVAALARRRRAGLVQVRCLAHDALDRAPIVSRTADDACELADAFVHAMQRLGRPWWMCLSQLPEGDAFAATLSRRLATVVTRPGADRPIVLLDDNHQPARVISRNLRKAEAKARNRIARAHLDCEERWITDARTIAERFSEIRSVHRERDLDLRHMSLLDDPLERAFYDALLHRHLELLELFELRLQKELAAYVLWIRNRAARLVLDNRVAPRWKRYSAGLIANIAALRTAASDPTINVLDWGTGSQRYKLESANKVVPHVELLAWSSGAVRSALAIRRLLHLSRSR